MVFEEGGVCIMRLFSLKVCWILSKISLIGRGGSLVSVFLGKASSGGYNHEK